MATKKGNTAKIVVALLYTLYYFFKTVVRMLRNEFMPCINIYW